MCFHNSKRCTGAASGCLQRFVRRLRGPAKSRGGELATFGDRTSGHQEDQPNRRNAGSEAMQNDGAASYRGKMENGRERTVGDQYRNNIEAEHCNASETAAKQIGEDPIGESA
jgi:hypothetical protein